MIEKIMSPGSRMDSTVVANHVVRILSIATRKPLTLESRIRDLGLNGRASRLKDWAESHFGFEFSKEDRRARIKTLEDFKILLVKYISDMKMFAV